MKKKLWKESFWTTSYCLITVGGAPITVLKKYIPILNGIQEEAPQARADESVQIAREEAESSGNELLGFIQDWYII